MNTLNMATKFCLLVLLSNFLISPARASDEEYWRSDLGAAMKFARQANYPDSLPVLQRLHKEHPSDAEVTGDYVAVLDWSGQDEQALLLFKTLSVDHQPDYVLLAGAHAYRVAGQPDRAAAIYHKGRMLYPNEPRFAAGEVRCLLDSGNLADAAQVSGDVVADAGKSQELNTVVEEARHVYAVSEAREGRYPEALQILAGLHETYPNDTRVTADDLAVTAWSGDDAGALALYAVLPQGQKPDYVYAAVGKAYRNTKQPDAAANLYREALRYYPDNKDFKVGEVNSLLESGHADEAAVLAGNNLPKDDATQAKVINSQEEIKKTELKAKQEAAVTLARKGQYADALKALRPLLKAHPDDLSLKQDYIAVLSWSGQHNDATDAYQAYGRALIQDFVLSAVGHSYREIKKFPQALAVYKRGLAQSPDNESFAVGVIGAEIDLKHYAEAQKTAEDDMRVHGNRLDVLLLAAEAADGNNKVYDSLTYAQQALTIDPNNQAALHAEVHAEDRMGAANAAKDLATEKHVTLTARDNSEIEGDQDAALVRWGKLEPSSTPQRYKGSDQAIETLDQKIATWSKQGNAKTPDIMRARFDRIVALRDRFRMQEAVNEYEALRNEGVTVPAYVLGPVGDAYLYLRQPEAARDVYLQALKSTPDDYEVRRQLYFAYVESDDFGNAYATIDKLRDEQPVWYYLKGDPERQPNPNRALAEIDSANARMYSGELADANDRLQPIADAAPYDVHSKEALGSLYLTRGWPHQALQEFRLGTRAQNGEDVGTQNGAALAALDMRDYRNATTETKQLSAAYPEDLDVQRTQRQLDVYNMAELRVNSFYNLRGSGNAAGGEGYGVDADLYSAPIDYNWRVFAGTGYAHEDEPNGEGTVGFEQSRAGVEYRDVHLVATAAPTYNLYNGSSRAGFDTSGEWTFNDFWTAGGAYQSFSNDTPLRALNQGITSARYAGNVEWRQSESREVRFDGDLMPFSDGNTRLNGVVTYSERLYTNPYWRVDAIVDGSSTHDTGDANRDYYNPKLDLTALGGARATQTLFRRYETLYEHSLLITPGAYWEESHGTRPAWTVAYQQELHMNDTLDLTAGVNYGHQAYDGVQEDNVSFLLNLVERF